MSHIVFLDAHIVRKGNYNVVLPFSKVYIICKGAENFFTTLPNFCMKNHTHLPLLHAKIFESHQKISVFTVLKRALITGVPRLFRHDLTFGLYQRLCFQEKRNEPKNFRTFHDRRPPCNS